MLEAARERGGGGRKLLAGGEGGFHSTFSVVPPGYVMAPHRHDYDELVIVLSGGCTWSHGPVTFAGDSVVMPGGEVHGYTTGLDGMTLLTVAQGPFRTELV
jgi:quercetin dioxygenase-like cupin family protein